VARLDQELTLLARGRGAAILRTRDAPPGRRDVREMATTVETKLQKALEQVEERLSQLEQRAEALDERAILLDERAKELAAGVERIEQGLERLLEAIARCQALEARLSKRVEDREAEQREWEDIKQSMLDEMGVESLDELDEQIRSAGRSELHAVMESMTYDEWLRYMEEE
jgi:chromosome segregation ATPase